MLTQVELPIVEPIFCTYQSQACVAAAIYENPSIRFWYLNHIANISCERKFLIGFSSPRINHVGANFHDNPHIERIWYPMRFAKGYIHSIIREFLKNGYCVYFNGVDDYYVENKSWYHQRHFNHDGMICGYDQAAKTYSLFAYDLHWICRRFKTSQQSFERGRQAMFAKGEYGNIFGLRPRPAEVFFDATVALDSIREYMCSSLQMYPWDGTGMVKGIVVHQYMAAYLDMLQDGRIPYDYIDRRVFRLLWEHKKAMAERIQLIEKECKIGDSVSRRYQRVVDDADRARMLYASHVLKRRDTLLPLIRSLLIAYMEEEDRLLKELLNKTGCGEEL